jgi:hypothetical protein
MQVGGDNTVQMMTRSVSSSHLILNITNQVLCFHAGKRSVYCQCWSVQGAPQWAPSLGRRNSDFCPRTPCSLPDPGQAAATLVDLYP